MKTRFVHVNLVARDWRRLAGFYCNVFGCVIVPPQRHLKGEWLSAATGIPQAALDGVHLRLPGEAHDGPTLEIFQYSSLEPQLWPEANRPGFGHIAFEVADVRSTAATIIAQGGSLVGEIVEREIERAGVITFVYARDPEGNMIEVQQWAAPPGR